jgi:alkylation response protein AidB-like acyl-CoA dehydrogenase
MSQFGEMQAFADPSWYQGVSSPYYGKSHEQLRAMVKSLVESDLIPNVHEWDEAGEIPAQFRVKAYSTGMAILACGHPFPVEYGPPLPNFLRNVKLDEFHAIIVFQELAKAGSIGVLWGLGAGLCIGLPPVLHHGSDYLKQKVVPSVLRGEKVICLAVTEPNAGSDVSNVQTSAVKSACGKFYIVNGVKKWITNGIFSDFMTVLVRTKEGAGAKGLSMLLIESESPGVKRQKMKCSGVWSSGTTLISFDNVKVPVEHLIGKENKGFKYCVSNFNHERLIICAQAVASARVCYEQAWKHAHRRKTFGKALVEHQVIRFKLGDMARLIESCQAWLENVAFQLETMHPMEANMKLSGHAALLKVQCTKALEMCAREASQIFGGLSFTRGGLGEMVERLHREVKSLAIPGGSEEIMLDLGVKMTSKLSQLGQQFLTNESPGMAKQLSLAKRVGVNMDLFGEGFPFGDPSWYLTFNSAFYNASHKRFRSLMRDFVERECQLPAVVSDMDEAQMINPDVRNKFFEKGFGFLAAGLRGPLQGIQTDLFHELIAIDELARVGSMGLMASLWWSVAEPVALLNSVAPSGFVSSLIEKIASGQSRCAVAISELGSSGHDLAGIETILSNSIVTGRKGYVTNAMEADCFIVAAKDQSSGNLSFVFVDDRDRRCMRTPVRTSGCWAGSIASVSIDGAPGIVLGSPGEGMKIRAAAARRIRWTAAVQAIRFARVCYEEALKHSQNREAFGKTLVDHQGVRWKLGEMARQIEGAFSWLEALTYHVSSARNYEHVAPHISLLRVHTTKVFEYCAREASQILGTSATLRGNVAERLTREVRAMAFVGGSEEVLLDQAVREAQLFGKSESKSNEGVIKLAARL